MAENPLPNLAAVGLPLLAVTVAVWFRKPATAVTTPAWCRKTCVRVVSAGRPDWCRCVRYRFPSWRTTGVVLVGLSGFVVDFGLFIQSKS